MHERKLPKLKKFPASKQRRMDELIEKNSGGTISAREKERLEALVREAEELTVSNSKLVAGFAKGQSQSAPSQAVPVTVWVSPELAGK